MGPDMVKSRFFLSFFFRSMRRLETSLFTFFSLSAVRSSFVLLVRTSVFCLFLGSNFEQQVFSAFRSVLLITGSSSHFRAGKGWCEAASVFPGKNGRGVEGFSGAAR